jgi:hypothetical protein
MKFGAASAVQVAEGVPGNEAFAVSVEPATRSSQPTRVGLSPRFC